MGIAGLAHVELYSPALEAAREHFLETAGLIECLEEEGDRVFLRGFGDWQHYSLVLRPGDDWGCRHVAWAVADPADLDEYAERIKAAGYDTEWVDPGAEPGQGRALRFDYPGASPEYQELVYDVERAFDALPDRPALRNQPSEKPTRGAGYRRIDHVNFDLSNTAEAVEFMADVLDFAVYEEMVDGAGEQIMAWLSTSDLHHSLAFAGHGNTDRVDHVAFYVDGGQTGALHRAADLIRQEPGSTLEAGPGMHGISQGQFLYYEEPSGNPMEVFAGSFLVLDPRWETVTWTPDDEPQSHLWWGGGLE